MNNTIQTQNIVALHDQPVTIEANNFRFKSLSAWCCNMFLGCMHACPICFAPETSANKQKQMLRSFGILDPVLDWGRYLLLRPLDKQKFLASLQRAVETHPGLRKRDGNDAVMFCSTTDAYQVIHHASPGEQRRFQRMAKNSRRWMLVAIRDHSDLNVRILTRSPLAQEDFDIFQSLGNRLLLGTSLPTLDPVISRIYEPKVSAPRQRLKLLTDAHEAGIPTYVAVAPVYPEVGYDGMLEVLEAVTDSSPHTVFLEPVNLKLEIAQRVRREARRQGRDIDTTPYSDSGAWSDYAIRTLREAERAADVAGISARLHLWPDHEGLSLKSVIERQPDSEEYLSWLRRWWDRVSEWPGR
ncbi:MAG: radical SAM protein [Phaeobacter gallaeciensis]